MFDSEKVILTLKENKVFELDGAIPAEAAAKIASGWPEVYAGSICGSRGRAYAMCGRGDDKRLFIISPAARSAPLAGLDFVPEQSTRDEENGEKYDVAVCAPTAENAASLRKEFPFTAPVNGGIRPAFGLGDRLGIATPGHIRAVRGYYVFPVLAQQSVREMHRTARSPRQVMDDVSWAVFQEGFRAPFGSDADHLKSEDDVRMMAAAGFNMYTIDPSEQINNRADSMGDGELAKSFDELFNGDKLSRNALIERYDGSEFVLNDKEDRAAATLIIKPRDLMRIAVKYLPAVRHSAALARLIEKLRGAEGHDLEISVDETDTPTTPEAHLFVAMELRELGVFPQSIAPRFTGQFQKGIDFIGDIAEFTRSARLHALIARSMGPYKLSVHSGSDKFSVFPIIAKLTGGLFHEKTAGTSYLEAVRVVARRDPALYRELHAFALERFEQDRASYHVTTNLSAIPPLDSLTDCDLPGLLDKPDSRQLLHITYGSALTETGTDALPRFRDRMYDVLNNNEEEHYETVAGHIWRHIDSLGIKPLKQ